MNYSLVAIIFNPISTGPSKSMARELEAKIHEEMPGQTVELFATEFAGHAEELAYKISKEHKNPLIISSSGDGGYHEVVNGVLKAQAEGATPTTGLLPAGNANDHHRNLYDGDMVERIMSGKPKKIDVLMLEATAGGKKIQRYAHSYIGFGLTPIIGAELNKIKLNFFTEILIVARSLLAVKSVKLKINGKARRYESVIFSNIDSMSKYLQISQPSSVTDGKFEVTIFKRRNKFQLLLTLLRTSVGALKEDKRVSEFTLTTTKDTLVQADGEILTLDGGTTVRVSAERQMLASVL